MGPMSFGEQDQMGSILPLLMREDMVRRRGAGPRQMSLQQLLSILGGGGGGGSLGNPNIPPTFPNQNNPSSGRPAGGAGLPFSNF